MHFMQEDAIGAGIDEAEELGAMDGGRGCVCLVSRIIFDFNGN